MNDLPKPRRLKGFSKDDGAEAPGGRTGLIGTAGAAHRTQTV